MALDDIVRRQTRLIRDIQIVHQDLLPLATSKNKIPGTTLDAFAAYLQENSKNNDWCAFSSGLGPIVAGVVKENAAKGILVKVYIDAAVS